MMSLLYLHGIVSDDKLRLQNIIQYAKTWDDFKTMLSNIDYSDWPKVTKLDVDLKAKKDEAHKIRDDFKKNIKEKIALSVSRTSSSIMQDFEVIKPIIRKLSNLVLEFANEFEARKKEKNCLDFNDFEHYALRILVNEDGTPTEVAKKYQEKFVEIAIDEYQDSNLVQETILNSISKGNNIFMVGDVKQSIYKFRQARPELFLNKYETYKIKEDKKDEDNLKIQLFRNFRSRENILDFTNLVFEAIMTKNVGDINYNETEYLNLGADYKEPEEDINYAGTAEMLLIDLKENEETTIYKEENNQDENNKKENIQEQNINEANMQETNLRKNELKNNGQTVEINHMTQKDENKSGEETERVEDQVLEASLVAKKIQELFKTNYMVYEKNVGYRKIRPKDIVILLRAPSGIAPIYEKELMDLGLPVFSDTSVSYLESAEIETILSILKIIDNPLQDIPFVVVLRSTIGNFTDNDLVRIRLTDRNCPFYEAFLKARISAKDDLKNKIEQFMEKLEIWKEKEKYIPLDELIWQIYLDTGYYQYVGLLPNGAMRQANLKSLFEKAKQYESASYKGLFNFIHFIEKLKKQNGDLSSAKLIGENEDVIRIMSIHKSKGLEFPVVFLCSTQKQFNLMDLNDSILLHNELGFGPTIIDNERKIKYSTMAKNAMRLKMRQEILSEEERVLYVALTRAKEKIFITGRSKDLTKDLQAKEKLVGLYSNTSIDDIKLDSKLIDKGKSYLDWLLYVYMSQKGKTVTLKGNKLPLDEIVTIKTYTKKELIDSLQVKEEIENANLREKIEQKLKDTKKEESEKIQQDLNELLSWKYKYMVDTKLPTKTSVTKIKEEKMKLSDDLNLSEDVESEEDAKEIKLKENLNEKEQINKLEISPKFLQEKETITGAHKGTLAHLIVQKLDETKDYTMEDIKSLIQELVAKEIITGEEANAIDTETIYRYTQSDLFKALKEAKEIHKEQPFYITLPANEIIKEAQEVGSEKTILVQGIIDLYYISKDDELILIDFKTDHVEDEKNAKEALYEKYKVQLEIYKQALENALGRKVEKAELYLLR